MTDNALAVSSNDSELAAIAAVKNDLSALTEPQRAQLYGAVCKSIGLNPLTSPFEYIKLNGKLTLYAKKGATDQLRGLRGISIVSTTKDVMEGVLMVTVVAQDASGRQDTDIGVVAIKGLQGEALANAYMKALTKAKRRVTLSLAGLGFLDDSEIDSIPAERAQRVQVDTITGEIVDEPQPKSPKAIADGAPDDIETARRYFGDIVKRAKINEAEVAAMIRKWGIPTGTTKDMNLVQLQKACEFLVGRDDPKAYASTQLANEKELEEINMTLEEAMD